MMTSRIGIRSPVAGTWLVRLDDTMDIPDGQSWSDAAIAVHHYGSDDLEEGWWDCKACGSGTTSRGHCEHILAVQDDEASPCMCGHAPSSHCHWPSGQRTICWDIECPCDSYSSKEGGSK